MTAVLPEPTPIQGGWCIKVRDDGHYCIDVIKMVFNYRVVLSIVEDGRSRHLMADAGYCYYGHGIDESGKPRTMAAAQLAAIAAATTWDGYGDPAGYDKRAF